MSKKILKLTAVIMCTMLILTGCGVDNHKNNTDNKENTNIMELKDKLVKVEMEDGAYFVMELYPEYAPETVKNFVELAESGFYNGLTIHRIVPGFVIQGGCPKGNGTGNSGKNIKGEFASNGFKDNTLSHTKGIVSMARAQNPDSASCQFFVCLDDASFLDGDYAAFGKVIEGMDTVEAIAKERTDLSDKPLTPVIMKNVTVITK